MYELNGNLNILGDKIHEDLDQIIHKKYEIKIKNEGEFEEETAYLQ